MKKLWLIILITCLLTGSFYLFTSFKSSNYNSPKNGQLILDPFTGNTPAGYFIRPLLGIPLGADCDRVKWDVTFYRDVTTHRPSVFKLSCIYGLQENSAPGFVDGGKKVESEGVWTIIKGAKNNPEAVIYKLTTGSGQQILFVKMSDDIIHLLYTDKSLMIGHAGWSYTLNRLKK